MAKLTFSVTDIRLGALYRVAARRRLDRPAIISLLIARVGLNPKASEQLAGHWLMTEPFRLSPAS